MSSYEYGLRSSDMISQIAHEIKISRLNGSAYAKGLELFILNHPEMFAEAFLMPR